MNCYLPLCFNFVQVYHTFHDEVSSYNTFHLHSVALRKNNNNNNNSNNNQYLSRVTPSVVRTVINESPDVKIELKFKGAGFCGGRRKENWRTQRKTLRARREPTTNSTHMRRRVRESNPRHRGGRQALIHCANHAP